jgi:pimeloyl-ACP methyl ester carboxylesterase
VAAGNILAVAQALGLASFSVAAAGCGAAVAACLAARGDSRITRFMAADIWPPDAARAAQIAPDLPLAPSGAHWLQAWLMLRDGQIYHPWFDGRIAAQRKTQGNFNADWLHEQTVALMEGRASCHQLPRAAALYPAAEMFRLSGATVHHLPDDALAAGFSTVFIKDIEHAINA